MLLISEILGSLIKHYQDDAKALNSEATSRLVLPGLTDNIAKEIHNYLRNEGTTSYLIVGNELKSNEEEGWMKAEGLTSRRIGSFVAVACKGQLSKVQDSIRGTSGVIRSETFSEEWPWEDNQSELLRFEEQILPKLISNWTENPDHQKWLKEFIIQLKFYIRSSPKRESIFLEEILGEFSKNLYEEIEDIREKILFHVGIPRPENILEDVKATLNSAKSDCENIIKKIEKSNARGDAIKMVNEVFDEKDEREKAIISLNYFLDRLGASSHKDLGPLSFYGCWQKKYEHWERLPASILRRLFGTPRPDSPGELWVEEFGCERSKCWENNIATFKGEEITFSGSCNIPDDHEKEWTLKLTHNNGQDVIPPMVINQNEFNFEFSFPIGEELSLNEPVKLRLSLCVDGITDQEISYELHVCSEERQAFSVVVPGFNVVNAYESSYWDEILYETISTGAPVVVHLFYFESGSPSLFDQDLAKIYDINNVKKGIWSSEKIDASEGYHGTEIRVCKFDDLEARICLETLAIVDGEFTLEDELRVQITKGAKTKTHKILDIFEGKTTEPCQQLGKINHESKILTTIANEMTSEKGCRPILANFEILGEGIIKEFGDHVFSLGEIDTNLFKDLRLREETVKLIDRYTSVRWQIIGIIQETLEPINKKIKHPDYAMYPIYFEKRAEEIEELLVQYLGVYNEIIDYVKQENELMWPEIFLILYFDCVVSWKDKETRNNFFLIGPWHPFVLAKRYMVQYSLVKRARRLVEGGVEGKRFSKLVALLKGISGVRWITGKAKNANDLELLYVIPTSDPGWHFALKNSPSTGNNIIEIVKRIREGIGLEINIFEGSVDALAGSGVKSFMRTFPSRRSIGVAVPPAYSTSQIVSSIKRVLYSDDGPTDLGHYLPGGIRIIFSEEYKGNLDELYPETPILIYDSKDPANDSGEFYPDILLMEPKNDLEFRLSREKNVGLPRGVDKESVFSESLNRMVQGQSALPESNTLESDVPPGEVLDELGNAFVRAAATACNSVDQNIQIRNILPLPEKLDFPWVIAPGGNMDPAIFVQWVRDGANSGLDRALWDYTVDIGESKNTQYILSSIPKGFSASVNGFFDHEVAEEFITDLGKLGIAIGGEALKSGRNALGAIGIVGTIRLLVGDHEKNIEGVFRNDKDSAGFLIPIDAFMSFFDLEDKRTDILAIQLVLTGEDESHLDIFARGIESKFVKSTFSDQDANKALEQARSTIKQFKELIEFSLKNGGMPERLGLLNILKFGLRISSPDSRKQDEINEWINKEQRIYQSVLQGKYAYKENRCEAVVISTEGGLPGPAEDREITNGIWLRINKDHWPGVNETHYIKKLRDKLSNLFGIPKNNTRKTIIVDDSKQIEPNETKKIPITTIIDSQEDQSIGLGEENDENKSNNVNGELVNNDISESKKIHGSAGKFEKIIIGMNDAREPIYFDPEASRNPSENYNLMVTGNSGSGKTQFIKYLIWKFREQGRNVLVFDFKGDYTNKDHFCTKSSLGQVFVYDNGLPFNPLFPRIDIDKVTKEKRINIGQHIFGIASVLNKNDRGSHRQEASIREAIKIALREKGIPDSGIFAYEPSMEFPDMRDVGETLRISNIGAYQKIEEMFSLGLFRQENSKYSFETLLKKSLVLDFSSIQKKEIKNTLAELIVLSAHNYYHSQPQKSTISEVLVFDEAWRVLKSNYMEEFVRECRAFGVSTILSSQSSSDFIGEISGQLDSKIMHSCGRNTDNVKKFVNMIGCSPEQEKKVPVLNLFQAFVANSQTPPTMLHTMNYPLYIVYSFLNEKKEASWEEISSIDGIFPNKLDFILEQLEARGLAEKKDGIIRLVDRDG
jgi:hypothetical protein